MSFSRNGRWAEALIDAQAASRWPRSCFIVCLSRAQSVHEWLYERAMSV